MPDQTPPLQISVIDDRMHPFFLHHSDNPGLVLVSQLLTGDNYSSWSRAMLIALSVKNKIGFIDGSLPKPEETDQFMFNAWKRNNNMVISWLLNSVSKEISTSIMFAETAFEIWIDLKDRFQQSNGPRVFQIRREIINLAQSHDSVGVYYTKLKSLTEELTHFRPHCSCGKCEGGGVKEIEKYFQIEHVMNFLMGLHDTFSQIRGQILLMDPMPPVNRVFSLVLQEEKQRSVATVGQSSPTMAFSAKTAPTKGNAVNRSARQDRPFCTHCKFQGHTVERCYKLHGYPPGYKPKPRANVVSTNNSVSSFDTDFGSVLHGLSSTQCQKLVDVISSHMNSVNTEGGEVCAPTIETAGFEGQENDWQG